MDIFKGQGPMTKEPWQVLASMGSLINVRHKHNATEGRYEVVVEDKDRKVFNCTVL